MKLLGKRRKRATEAEQQALAKAREEKKRHAACSFNSWTYDPLLAQRIQQLEIEARDAGYQLRPIWTGEVRAGLFWCLDNYDADLHSLQGIEAIVRRTD